MKYGNVSHTIVKLPSFYLTPHLYENIDTFNINNHYHYFKPLMLLRSEKDGNFNRNFRKKLTWKKEERIHNSNEITVKSTLSTKSNLNNNFNATSSSNNNKISKKTISSISEENIKKSKTMKTMKSNISDGLESINKISNLTQQQEFDLQFEKAENENLRNQAKTALLPYYPCINQQNFRDTGFKKVMSLRCVSDKVKSEYMRRSWCIEDKRSFIGRGPKYKSFKDSINEITIKRIKINNNNKMLNTNMSNDTSIRKTLLYSINRNYLNKSNSSLL